MSDNLLEGLSHAETSPLDVVLVTNRASEFLPEALASVEGQIGVTCNLVIVDDGSADPSYIRGCAAAVARSVVVRQEPAGISAARNRGLRESDGTFVAFLDDDDAWHPTKAIKQVRALEQDPSAVGCGCWGWYVDAAGDKLGSWAPVEVRPSSDYLSGAALLPRIVTLTFTRSVCETIGGFDESLRHCEDLEFALRALLHGGFAAVPEKLVYYRQHDGNVSHAGIVPARDEGARMLAKLITMSESAGDLQTSSLLRRNLTQLRGREFLQSVRSLRSAVRSKSLDVVADEARWLSRHPHWLPQAVPQALDHLRQR